jgi:transforming growth factor-beta-induced protein
MLLCNSWPAETTYFFLLAPLTTDFFWWTISVDVACGLDDFSTLCSAVTLAGLGDALTDGTWTVFAPTNQAFAKLGQDLLDTVLADEALLTDILLFHAVDDVVASTDLFCTGLTEMANGQESRTVCVGDDIFQKGGTNPRNDMPKIVQTDIPTCQGLIHVIGKFNFLMLCRSVPVKTSDYSPLSPSGWNLQMKSCFPTVLLPLLLPIPNARLSVRKLEQTTTFIGYFSRSGKKSHFAFYIVLLAEIACGTDDFSTLCTAVTAVGLGDALSGDGPWTVFAPTNAAFEALDQDLLAAVLADADLLTSVLLFHAVDKVLFAHDLECSHLVHMASGGDSRHVCTDDGVFQKGSGNPRTAMPKIVDADIGACNGVIHVVDQVMLP